MFWKKYSSFISIVLLIILIVAILILIQNSIGESKTIFIQNNQTFIFQNGKSIIDNIFPILYVLIGGLFTFLITEYKSIKTEEKIFSVLKMDIKTNLKILKFNREKLEYEHRLKGISYVPLKLFKTDSWNLISYNPPNKLINQELYTKISEAILIMNSFNEINQVKEYHKAFSKERVVKEKSFTNTLLKEIDNLSNLLLEIETEL